MSKDESHGLLSLGTGINEKARRLFYILVGGKFTKANPDGSVNDLVW